MDLTTSNSGIKICIVCAMEDEARQFSRALRKYPAPATVSIDVVQTGIGPTRVCAALTNILHTRPDGILIFGTAAGLDESLDAGDTVLYVDVVSETGKNFSTSVRLTDYLAAVLKPLTPRRGAGRTSNTPVCTPAAKAHLHESTGSQCVDMESATVATFAHWHNIPIAAVRVVVDSASETIPSAALAGMQEDGRANPWLTLGALIRNPVELPSILKLATHYRRALKSLNRAANLVAADINQRSPTELATYFSTI